MKNAGLETLEWFQEITWTTLDPIPGIIILQIRAMSIYGLNDSVIYHPYITDILRYTKVAKVRPKSCKVLHFTTLFLVVKCVLLEICGVTDKSLILLNLAEHRLILAYGLVG